MAAGLCLAGCQGSDEDALSVVVTLPAHDVAGAAKATVLVDYSGTGAKILNEGGVPACAFILPGVDGDFADDRKGTLTIHTNGARALRGPADIAACRMKAGSPDVTASDLHAKLSVKVASAEDSAGKAIDVAAKSSKGHGGSAAGELSDSAIEEAQQAAVRAAASAAPPSSAPGPATGASGSGDANTAGLATVPKPGPAASGAAAAAAATTQKPTPKAAPPGGLLQSPVASPSAAAGDGAAGNPDRDPSYDDSASEDEQAPAYSLDFFVQTAGTFGALQLEITHLGRSGGFIGRGDKIDCVSLVEAIVASNYVGERVAKVGLISLAGIRTPVAIMRCGFRTRENLGPPSFAIDVTDASDTESKPLDPPPTVVISTITRR